MVTTQARRRAIVGTGFAILRSDRNPRGRAPANYAGPRGINDGPKPNVHTSNNLNSHVLGLDAAHAEEFKQLPWGPKIVDASVCIPRCKLHDLVFKSFTRVRTVSESCSHLGSALRFLCTRRASTIGLICSNCSPRTRELPGPSQEIAKAQTGAVQRWIEIGKTLPGG